MRLDKITIVVDDYDRAIGFFTRVLGFDLVEDSPSLTNDGRAKRWVVVRPPGGETGILLARADGDRQDSAVGNQTGGRVGFFLWADDFNAAWQRMTAAGVRFLTAPRTEPYGRVAVFADLWGNRWDLLGPALSGRSPIQSQCPGSVSASTASLIRENAPLYEINCSLTHIGIRYAEKPKWRCAPDLRFRMPGYGIQEGITLMRARMRVLAPVIALVMLAAAAGCGSARGDSSSAGGLEKTTLKVAVVPAVDSAGFFVALHEGLFAKDGLTIKYTPATSSDTVIDQQIAGAYDITGGNYVSYVQHYVQDRQPLQIVAEGSVMQQGSQAIYTLPDSKIKTLAQLKGQMLGINAPGNINYLLAASVLTENGISVSRVDFPKQPIPFPIMAGELAAGKIAAAAMPEPFATAAEQKYGAVVLADLNQGATQSFPIQGYVATRSWIRRNPHTLRAFLAALKQGQEIADTSRAAVEQAMETLNGPMNGQVPPIVASVMALNTYPIGIDAARLQRIPDVMLQFGLLHSRFDIRQMIAG